MTPRDSKDSKQSKSSAIANSGSVIVANHERKYQESISSANHLSDLAFANEQSDKHVQEMADLRESRIICKGMLFIFVPFCIFGTLAMFFPGMYALFPMQESETCICAFYEMQSEGHRHFMIDL